jgi:hypothetical protein
MFSQPAPVPWGWAHSEFEQIWFPYYLSMFRCVPLRWIRNCFVCCLNTWFPCWKHEREENRSGDESTRLFTEEKSRLSVRTYCRSGCFVSYSGWETAAENGFINGITLAQVFHRWRFHWTCITLATSGRCKLSIVVFSLSSLAEMRYSLAQRLMLGRWFVRWKRRLHVWLPRGLLEQIQNGEEFDGVGFDTIWGQPRGFSHTLVYLYLEYLRRMYELLLSRDKRV